jgi:hypothetical protein
MPAAWASNFSSAAGGFVFLRPWRKSAVDFGAGQLFQQLARSLGLAFRKAANCPWESSIERVKRP